MFRAGETMPHDGYWARDHCCEGDHTVFNVRVGPNYSRNKKKAPSARPFFVPFAVDIFRLRAKVRAHGTLEAGCSMFESHELARVHAHVSDMYSLSRAVAMAV